MRKGSAAAAVGMTGLAGCSDILGSDGDNTAQIGDVESWLVAPSVVSSELDHYSFDARSPSALASTVSEPLLERNWGEDLPFGSATARDIDFRINASPGRSSFTVYVGSFDADWIQTQVRNSEFERVRSIDDVTVYERSENRRGIAVSSDVIIETNVEGFDTEASRIAGNLIDSENGDVTRYTDADSDMQQLIDTLPGGHGFSGRTFERREQNNPESGILERQVAEGRTWELDGEVTNVTIALVFLSEADVVERDIQAYIEESNALPNYTSRPSYDIDGRTVTIEGNTTAWWY
ncbi:MAG: hypothetical protein V5A27_05930 [Halapricum sp.]